MAIGDPIGANPATDAVVQFTSPRLRWYDANTDLTIAQSATDLGQPQGIDDESFRWIRCGGGTSLAHVRMRYSTTVSVVNPSPTVRVVGAWLRDTTIDSKQLEEEYAGTFSAQSPADNYATFMRLDRLDNGDSAGLDLVIDVVNDFATATERWTDPATNDGTLPKAIDLQGADWIGVICSSAGDIAGGSGTLVAEVGLL